MKNPHVKPWITLGLLQNHNNAGNSYENDCKHENKRDK